MEQDELIRRRAARDLGDQDRNRAPTSVHPRREANATSTGPGKRDQLLPIVVIDAQDRDGRLPVD
jgi:hypothetical protein